MHVHGFWALIGLSGIALAEIISSFCCLCREASIDDQKYRQLKTSLLIDIVVCDLTPEILHQTIYSLEKNVLQGMDALHIGSAIVIKADIFVSADSRQYNAASNSGLRVEQF